jgi:ABC-type polar amino acid transport system ATPase subunit
VIRVEGLTKRYGDSPILNGVSFEVAEGRLAAIVGPSGAGKTTLLRCLTGLERFDAGLVRVDGTEVRAGGQLALRGRVGLVFQSFELFPHLTVLENCTLAPVKVKGVTPDDAAGLASKLLDELGLGAKAGAYPDLLSGGQRQRVAIARALALEPKVLLYDEPTSALDASLRQEVRDTLKRVRSTGVTQLVVTHDNSLAEDCEQVIRLEAGRVVK